MSFGLPIGHYPSLNLCDVTSGSFFFLLRPVYLSVYLSILWPVCLFLGHSFHLFHSFSVLASICHFFFSSVFPFPLFVLFNFCPSILFSFDLSIRVPLSSFSLLSSVHSSVSLSPSYCISLPVIHPSLSLSPLPSFPLFLSFVSLLFVFLPLLQFIFLSSPLLSRPLSLSLFLTLSHAVTASTSDAEIMFAGRVNLCKLCYRLLWRVFPAAEPRIDTWHPSHRRENHVSAVLEMPKYCCLRWGKSSKREVEKSLRFNWWY